MDAVGRLGTGVVNQGTHRSHTLNRCSGCRTSREPCSRITSRARHRS